MSEPLFILTTPRLLTSQTCAMIGNHPDMACLAETNLFAAETYEELEAIYLIDPRFQHGLLRTIAEFGLGGQTEENVELAQAWLIDNESVKTADIFKDLMALVEPRHVVDTSVLYVYRPGVLDRIIKAFPDAYYLHLSLHPRLSCESIYKTRKAATESHLGRQIGTEIALKPETMWLKPHVQILGALENIAENQKLFLRGEDLFSDPQPNLLKIAEWLGIRTDEDAIDAMMRSEESPFACYGPENAPLGNDPHFLENPKFVPYVHHDLDLDSPMSWDNTLVFDATIKELARYFGY